MSKLYQGLLDLLAGMPLLNGYEQKTQGVFNLAIVVCLGLTAVALLLFYRSPNVNYTIKTWRFFWLITAILSAVSCFLLMLLILKVSSPDLEQIMYMIWFGIINFLLTIILFWLLSFLARLISVNYHHIPSSPFKKRGS